ncbi:hypothetical protein C0081_03055 [Cohaesibacter celericrescens]|uniref:Uncharacterized protein n=1 Tax=Cohaesibacter celericrescens TaxID=2067669 RepID=A0A2N5XXJ3_9HYPH|nr:hypothetical protein C0081_03055 [Cohaesibacter celericrescens]
MDHDDRFGLGMHCTSLVRAQGNKFLWSREWQILLALVGKATGGKQAVSRGNHPKFVFTRYLN